MEETQHSGTPNPHTLTAEEVLLAVRAAVIPPLIFTEDLRRLVGLRSRGQAWRHLRAGTFGPPRRIGLRGRLFVTKADFEAALEGMRVPDSERSRPRAMPRPRPDLVSVLRPRPRRARRGK